MERLEVVEMVVLVRVEVIVLVVLLVVGVEAVVIEVVVRSWEMVGGGRGGGGFCASFQLAVPARPQSDSLLVKNVLTGNIFTGSLLLV